MIPGSKESTDVPHLALIATSGGAFGGMETFTRGLVAWLLDDGWRVTIALSGHDFLSRDLLSDRLTICPVHWINVADLSGDRRYTRAVVADRLRWFRHMRPDVALFVQSSNTPLRASVLAARLAGVPVVTTQRTMPARIPALPSRRHLFGLVPGLGLHRHRLILGSRLTARLATRVVYNSHAVRALYESEYRYPIWRGVVIPNAVDAVYSNGACRKSSHRDTSTPASHSPRVRASESLLVGYVGRFGREKRLDVLLRAIAVLSSEVNVRAELYGDGPERQALIELSAELGLNDRVRFCGPTTNARGVFSRFDAVAICSPRESSSNMVLEAMAAGTPVVVTNVGGLPELVERGRAGICVEPLNSIQLAAALRQLALDPHERLRLGHAARERARVYHDPCRVFAQWTALLLSVAAVPAWRSRITARAARVPALEPMEVYS